MSEFRAAREGYHDTGRRQPVQRALLDAGEIATKAELARHWRVSNTLVGRRVRMPGFPAPAVIHGDVPLWSVAAADAWVVAYYRRLVEQGKPRPKMPGR